MAYTARKWMCGNAEKNMARLQAMAICSQWGYGMFVMLLNRC